MLKETGEHVREMMLDREAGQAERFHIVGGGVSRMLVVRHGGEIGSEETAEHLDSLLKRHAGGHAAEIADMRTQDNAMAGGHGHGVFHFPSDAEE